MVKGVQQYFSFVHCSHPIPQCQRGTGRIDLVDHKCTVVCYQPESHNLFILQTTIPPCLAGSRAWSGFFTSAGVKVLRPYCQTQSIGTAGGPHDHLLSAQRQQRHPITKGTQRSLPMTKATRTLTHRGEDDDKAQDRAQWIVWRLEL